MTDDIDNESYGDFLILGNKTFFSFIHDDGRTRSFTYSGVLDLDCAGNGSNLVIKHSSTKIVLNGSGLHLLNIHLLDENIKVVYENAPFKAEEGKLHTVSEIFYLDELEDEE